jgi:GTP-binding protein Era
MKCGFVSLIGRPNAGKSTLMNRIIGAKLAIVSDKPQTTRTRIQGIRNYPDAQLIVVDTPGIHKPQHRMNVRMVDAAVEAMRTVDVRVLVLDVMAPSGAGDRFILDLVKRSTGPLVVALNKIDGVRKQALLPIMDRFRLVPGVSDIVPVSALTGENVDRFEQVLLSHLPEGPALYPDDVLTDRPERFFAAEIVREQVLRCTHAELPFATAVVIDRFDETSDDGLVRLYCSILVERDSQKPIVIGKGGARIKEIGTEARKELQALLGRRVYLDLVVKVRSDWREDERVLHDAGVDTPGGTGSSGFDD